MRQNPLEVTCLLRHLQKSGSTPSIHWCNGGGHYREEHWHWGEETRALPFQQEHQEGGSWKQSVGMVDKRELSETDQKESKGLEH